MGSCVSKTSEAELAKQVLGSFKAKDAKTVRRLSALGMEEVWVTRQTSDLRKVFKFGPQINKGQFGVIYVVTNTAGEKFACKQISKKNLVGPTSIRDIRREIEVMHHLRGHPNVITFHGAYEDANDVYLIMELCTGGDLFERIERTATITERSAAALFRDLVQTVSYCHMLGVVHRDLKPENFLITDHSPSSRIKLADFGLSCFFQEGQELNDVVGSAYYMAPEVIQRQYGKSCDVWSLGVILHILLTGAPPFTGNSDGEILKAVRTQEVDLTADPWPSISRHARHLVSRMLDKDPDRRLRLDEVLVHPWLRVDGTAPPRALQGGVRDRIGRFRALNAFKREARRILATILPAEEVSGLKLLFEDLDCNGDGLLSQEELRQGLERMGERVQGEEMHALMQAADLNCDGYIDYREFVAATYTLSAMQQNDVMRKAFRHFDVDGDGYITKDELSSVLSALPSAYLMTSPSGRTRESVAQLLAEADLDSDGRVDYHEFCAMLLAPGGWGGVGGLQRQSGTEVAMQVVQLANLPGQVDEVPAAQRQSASTTSSATTSSATATTPSTTTAGAAYLVGSSMQSGRRSNQGSSGSSNRSTGKPGVLHAQRQHSPQQQQQQQQQQQSFSPPALPSARRSASPQTVVSAAPSAAVSMTGPSSMQRGAGPPGPSTQITPRRGALAAAVAGGAGTGSGTGMGVGVGAMQGPGWSTVPSRVSLGSDEDEGSGDDDDDDDDGAGFLPGKMPAGAGGMELGMRGRMPYGLVSVR